MKKVLIVAHLLSASPRIPGLAKYLPEFGWQPIVITAPLGERPDLHFGPPDDFTKSVRVIETSYYDILDLLRRLFRLDSSEPIDKEVRKRLGTTSRKSPVDFFVKLGGAIICYPDAERGWKNFAIRTGSELLQKEDVDAMISSSPPVTSHLIAKELKNQYKIPWVADLRDLWSQNHNYSYGPVRNLVDRRLELKTLSATDALVTVSQPLVEELRVLHKGKATYAITNGFDPAEANIPADSLTTKFTITYMGNIYSGKQDPSKLFVALRELISDGTIDPNDVEVRFYGYKIEWLTREIGEYGLAGIVKQYGMVPRQVSFQKQRESQLLLLLNWEDRLERGLYSLKIFEYLAARRPILATGGSGDDVVKELFIETKAGLYGARVESIKNILSDLYSEYKLKGKISYNGDEVKINRYSYREMAKKFAEILDGL